MKNLDECIFFFNQSSIFSSFVCSMKPKQLSTFLCVCALCGVLVCACVVCVYVCVCVHMCVCVHVCVTTRIIFASLIKVTLNNWPIWGEKIERAYHLAFQCDKGASTFPSLNFEHSMSHTSLKLSPLEIVSPGNQPDTRYLLCTLHQHVGQEGTHVFQHLKHTKVLEHSTLQLTSETQTKLLNCFWNT